MEDIEGFHNFIRVTLLLNKAGSVLRQMFRIEYKNYTGQSWLDVPLFGNEIAQKHCNDYFTRAQNTQQLLIKSGQVEKWDISILCNCLLSLAKKLQTRNLQYELNLKELREIRNTSAHLPDVKTSQVLSMSVFPVLWTSLSKILVSFGLAQSEIDDLKTAEIISGVELKNPNAALCQENIEKLRNILAEAETFQNFGDWTKAEWKYSQALKLSGISETSRGYLFACRSLARLKIFWRNLELGCSGFNELEQISKDALSDGESAIELRPSWSEGYTRVGHVYHAIDKLSLAVDYFNRALSLNPNQNQILSARKNCLDRMTDEQQRCLNLSVVMKTAPEFDEGATEYNIGRMYELGKGKSQSFEEARKWYTRSSNHGNSNADKKLATMLKDGIGGPKNVTEAIQFLELGAQRGNFEAVQSLASEFLECGDLFKAQFWFNRSIALFNQKLKDSRQNQ